MSDNATNVRGGFQQCIAEIFQLLLEKFVPTPAICKLDLLSCTLLCPAWRNLRFGDRKCVFFSEWYRWKCGPLCQGYLSTLQVLSYSDIKIRHPLPGPDSVIWITVLSCVIMFCVLNFVLSNNRFLQCLITDGLLMPQSECLAILTGDRWRHRVSMVSCQPQWSWYK